MRSLLPAMAMGKVLKMTPASMNILFMIFLFSKFRMS
jgi:hypothetical protein